MSTAADAPAATLTARAAAAGFAVLATAGWPESAADVTAPSPAGFVLSSFSPVAAEAANRCLLRRGGSDDASGEPPDRPVTAIIIVSSLGDIAGAAHVARAVDSGARVGPLLFFQCVPNAVAGYVAARWRLTGPVTCLGSEQAALDAAGLLIEDGDADEVLLVSVEQAVTADDRDRADAVLLGAGLPGADGPGNERGRA